MNMERGKGRVILKYFRVRRRDGRIRDIVCSIYEKREMTLLEKFIKRAEALTFH